MSVAIMNSYADVFTLLLYLALDISDLEVDVSIGIFVKHPEDVIHQSRPILAWQNH